MSLPVTCTRRYRTPAEVAGDLGVDLRKVLAWIRTGELRACNLATRVHGRPRWRVSAVDLECFLASRAVQPPVKVARKRRAPEGVTEYFR